MPPKKGMQKKETPADAASKAAAKAAPKAAPKAAAAPKTPPKKKPAAPRPAAAPAAAPAAPPSVSVPDEAAEITWLASTFGSPARGGQVSLADYNRLHTQVHNESTANLVRSQLSAGKERYAAEEEARQAVQRARVEEERARRAEIAATQEQLKQERIEGKRVQRELEAEWEKVRNARQKEHFETARKRVLEAKALDAKLDAAEEAVDAQERAEGKAMDAKIRAEFEAEQKRVYEEKKASAVYTRTFKRQSSAARLSAAERSAKARMSAAAQERQARRDALQKAKDDYARASSEKKALVERIRAQARAEREAVLNANKAHAAKEHANDIIAVQAKARVLAAKRASAERVKKAGTAPAPKLRQLSATEAKLRRAPSSGSWYLLSRAPGQADPGMSPARTSGAR